MASHRARAQAAPWQKQMPFETAVHRSGQTDSLSFVFTDFSSQELLRDITTPNQCIHPPSIIHTCAFLLGPQTTGPEYIYLHTVCWMNCISIEGGWVGYGAGGVLLQGNTGVLLWDVGLA